jgi:2-haloacid dehalogenase
MSGRRLRWVLFDLNGTLLDPGGMAEPLGGGDCNRRLVTEAFHEALLLTMADTLSGGGYRPLPEYLRAALERVLRANGRGLEVLDAAMERAAAMAPYPEAEAALSRLRGADLRSGVLTNSTTESAERALATAGLRERFDAVIGSDQVQTFKPHPRIYQRAVERLVEQPDDIVLVAAHGWDVMGAMRAGLRGAWVARSERWLVPVVPEPDVRGEDLEEVVGKIVALS